jgi:hypothetical protein
MHEVDEHTQVCVVVLQVGVVGVEAQSVFELHWPQVLVTAFTHSELVPVQQAEPQAVPMQLVQVVPEQMSVALEQQVTPPQTLPLAQVQAPLTQLGVRPLVQQAVPQAVPLQAAQVPPAVQYMPVLHELVVELQTQVCVVVLQVGVVGVDAQSAFVAQPTQVPPEHTAVGAVQQFEPHAVPAQLTQVPELPPVPQWSLALAQQLVVEPLVQLTPLAQPQLPALMQSGVPPEQHAVPQAVPEQATQAPPEQTWVPVQQAFPPQTVPLHEVQVPVVELQ